MVHDRIAAGEATVVSTAAVLRCGKQMERLPHYNFSWTVCLQKICEMLRLQLSSRSHSLENTVWKRLWTCRETDKYLSTSLPALTQRPIKSHGPQRKHNFQQFLYCCARICCRESIFTEPLPSDRRLLWCRYSFFQAR
jgi:hypothetical protein